MTSPRKRFAPHVVLLVLTALGLVRCGGDRAHCDTVRDETYQKREAWAHCDSDSECYPLLGNPNDCTGVLSCPFAVHRSHREEAEHLMLTMGEESVDCHLCALPNCTSTTTPICEELTHTCVMVERVGDAGLGSTLAPPIDRPDVYDPFPPSDLDASDALETQIGK